ncbi:hypothetical protein [Myxococcus sp. RHSTA-1-4]|uniref:hypothetical protein n=1 Tax=Myxococcus sp. RHSTA-1-4 TaxID=2874601 RepID=UPI001CBCEC2E
MSSAAPHRSEPFAGSALLHPLVLGAVVLLLLNDHVFKARWPSWWTGKLSDVAGLVMFPVLLQALWEKACVRAGRGFHPSRAVLVTCVLLTGLCFSAINVSEAAGQAWQWALGALQWPARAAWALVTESRTPRVAPVAHTVDAEDLLTLPALLVALAVGWRRAAAPREAGPVPERVSGTGD